MELAIPLIALGGMYIVSNQKPTQQCNNSNNQGNNGNKGNSENFTNMGIRSNLGVKTDNYLPNVNIPPQNYPVNNINQLVDTVQEYSNPNAATDKYFNQNLYENKVRDGKRTGDIIQDIYSLSGNYLKAEQFKHNNMVPFDGGKVKGYTYHANTAETILDNMVGSGSQTIKKIEQAPLFKPEENMQWAYGAPNNSDFYQSRVNPGMRANNVKPFDTVMVGPGLDKGYTVNGTGGYNSGMEARDKWLPYTVDQLRVATNPKLEYELTNHEGPANSFIKVAPDAQLQGRVEKNRPDTFFINSQDRWLTTTGAEKGETLRPIQETGVIRRNDVVVDYMGPAGTTDVKASYAPENFEPSKRNEVISGGVGHSTAAGKGTHEDKDIFLQSHTNYENQRSTGLQPETMRSGFSGAIGAVIAPIMDVFRPTRKHETVNNIRVYGHKGTGIPNGYVVNMNDATATTVKETTLYSPQFNINNQKEGMYVNNYTDPYLTQRDTTSSEYFSTPGGYASAYGDMSYEAAYRQHNNDIKSQTIDNRPNQGGTQIFNQQMNLTTIKSDSDRFDGRVNPAYSRLSGMPPSAQTYGAIRAPQYYDECQMCDRIQPDILTAFKNNPYTHSLTTSV
jgi:hypothetical protein